MRRLDARLDLSYARIQLLLLLAPVLRRVAVQRWSWSSVSERLLAVHLR